jgi:hypothetical protein
MELSQILDLVFTRDEMADLMWSVPEHDAIMSTDARNGIVRHGGVTDAVNHIPKEYKPRYPEHLRRLGVDWPKWSGVAIAFGARNTGPNNVGLPGFHSLWKTPLFAREIEPWRAWVYFGFVMFRSGDFDLHRIRFTGNNGHDILLLDAPERSPDVLWAITGQPLLWDGVVPAHSTNAAGTYDQRHSWHLAWESHEQARWPQCRHHYAAHSELMEAFMRHLNDGVNVRAAALSQVGASHGLAIEDSYLHSSLAVRDSGKLALMIRRGSLPQLGYAHMAAGSRRAILLDNGGSCGIGVWSPAALRENKLDEPIYIGNASYFRPNAHSLLVMKLRLESLEGKTFGFRREDRDLFGGV